IRRLGLTSRVALLSSVSQKSKECSSPVTDDLIISLIGMPGSGKSTVGKVLAERLALQLVDADGLIEAQEEQTLQQIMDGRGNNAFRAIEEQVLTDMALFPSVISTGGSVVYSEKIMARLAAASTVVYLRAQLSTIEYRVSLAPERGIASDGDQTLQDLYEERVPLYERYANIVVDCDEATPEQIAEHITQRISQRISQTNS
ncbi:MAG: shikimate kinase, partial [Luminiphilus sp.]